ncbi:uncharacterized protein [Euphorbia lathyris]|uniref:uncharacterized protein n=1 Tax=Euphorbia lathyris TaxID=212925 RepID=UPI0033136991
MGNQIPALPRPVYIPSLTASLDVIRFLLRQGLCFHGYDESSTSFNKGNFLELLEWYTSKNKYVGKVVGINAPQNNLMTCTSIQKEMTNACAVETTLLVLNDISDKCFTILVDESRDSSMKEKMAVVLRYVNKCGEVIERLLGVVHVKETSSQCLKDSIDALFAKHGLSLSRLRGQGYDGASNIRGKFKGLKTLILRENPHAFYVHCFAYQLQLVIIAVAKGSNKIVGDFFTLVTMIMNTSGASCK